MRMDGDGRKALGRRDNRLARRRRGRRPARWAEGPEGTLEILETKVNLLKAVGAPARAYYALQDAATVICDAVMVWAGREVRR